MVVVVTLVEKVVVLVVVLDSPNEKKSEKLQCYLIRGSFSALKDFR